MPTKALFEVDLSLIKAHWMLEIVVDKILLILSQIALAKFFQRHIDLESIVDYWLPIGIRTSSLI